MIPMPVILPINEITQDLCVLLILVMERRSYLEADLLQVLQQSSLRCLLQSHKLKHGGMMDLGRWAFIISVHKLTFRNRSLLNGEGSQRAECEW